MTPQHFPPPDYLEAWHALGNDEPAPDLGALLDQLGGDEDETANY